MKFFPTYTDKLVEFLGRKTASRENFLWTGSQKMTKSSFSSEENDRTERQNEFSTFLVDKFSTFPTTGG